MLSVRDGVRVSAMPTFLILGPFSSEFNQLIQATVPSRSILMAHGKYSSASDRKSNAKNNRLGFRSITIEYKCSLQAIYDCEVPMTTGTRL